MWGFLPSFETDLFGQFDRMRREFDTLFGTVASPSGIRAMAAGTFPAMNIGVAPSRVDVYLFAPGIDPKAVDITLQQNLLTVAGERRVMPPEGVDLYRTERFSGTFRRVVALPEDVDPNRVEATYRDGVLQLTLGRREEVQPRRIEVK
jgi:HSP20 family protein